MHVKILFFVEKCQNESALQYLVFKTVENRDLMKRFVWKKQFIGQMRYFRFYRACPVDSLHVYLA